MGIKKNAFFRDMVRVAAMEQIERFSKAWNELWKPLIAKFKNNVEAAVEEVLKTPQFMKLLGRVVPMERISDWLKAAEIPQDSTYRDIIQEERIKADRPEIPREASLNKISRSNQNIFYQLFKNQDASIYESVIKDKKVKAQTDDILNSDTPFNAKVTEIYNVVNRYILKEYYLWLQRNFQFIEDNVQRGMPLSMSHLKEACTINKVIIGYLNSLDQRI